MIFKFEPTLYETILNLARLRILAARLAFRRCSDGNYSLFHTILRTKSVRQPHFQIDARESRETTPLSEVNEHAQSSSLLTGLQRLRIWRALPSIWTPSRSICRKTNPTSHFPQPLEFFGCLFTKKRKKTVRFIFFPLLSKLSIPNCGVLLFSVTRGESV